MTIKFDHLTVIAPSLAIGAEHVRAQLGTDMPAGGKHPQMGTHNLLLRLGDDLFLEVIAVDPDAPRPGRPRWFGLDDHHAVQSAWDSGCRLRGWVARTDDFDGVLSCHGDLLGYKTQVSRGGRSWLFSVPADGALPGDGIAPSLIDWGARGSPAPAMPDLGMRLLSFRIEHPEPERVTQLYARLGIVDPPKVQKGAVLRFSATIATPAGPRELS